MPTKKYKRKMKILLFLKKRYVLIEEKYVPLHFKSVKS